MAAAEGDIAAITRMGAALLSAAEPDPEALEIEPISDATRSKSHGWNLLARQLTADGISTIPNSPFNDDSDLPAQVVYLGESFHHALQLIGLCPG